MRGEYPLYACRGWCGRELPPRARRILLMFPIESGGHGTTSACAENTGDFGHKCLKIGNYLRVRGEYRRNFRRCRVSLGTTSACAENTPDPNASYLIPGNYLRVRGEYRFCSSMKARSLELPPRARRIHPTSQPFFEPEGTTSACAENTPTRTFFRCGNRNYLRVRGEYPCRSAMGFRNLELPPRARRIHFPKY